MEIGSHLYGRDGDGEQLADGPVVATVVDELRARGANDRAEARRHLELVEQDLGELTDRERTAVLARFEN